MRKKRVLLLAITTILILYLIFKNVNYSYLLQEIKNINILGLFFAYIFMIIPISAIAYKWKILISDYKKLTFKESMRLHLAISSISLITPLKLGEFLNAIYKNDQKFSRQIGLGASIFEKSLDVLSLILISLISFFFLIEKNYVFLFLSTTAALILFFVCFNLVTKHNSPLRNIIEKFIKKLLPYKKLHDFSSDVLLYFKKIKHAPSKIISSFILSTLYWIGMIFQGYLLFLVIGVDIRFTLILAVLPVAMIIGMFPITFSGIGTRDGIFILLLIESLKYETIVLYGMLFSLKYAFLALWGLFWIKEVMKDIKIKD